MNAFLPCFVILLTTAAYAADLQCPQNSRGVYPACKCSNGAVYDSTYNWCVNFIESSLNFQSGQLFLKKIDYNFFRCASDLKSLNGECPEDGPGIFPNCQCGLGKSFDAIKQECITIDRSVCPTGATGLRILKKRVRQSIY